MWKMYFRNDATIVPEHVGPTDARIVLQGSAQPRYMCRYGISGWFSEMLTFYRCREPSAVHTRCKHDGDPVCEWSMSWS